jgi:hypothetical protein
MIREGERRRTETHGSVHDECLPGLGPRLAGSAVAGLDDDRCAIRITCRSQARRATRTRVDNMPRRGRRRRRRGGAAARTRRPRPFLVGSAGASPDLHLHPQDRI